ncbi:hypothetical protein JAAARDRAFT_192381 [Jaapia argillacea MUCL 33604]|uniref:ZZ-type domain-containing protein n=1 Tax=Jaapia argillacea MUCL 33604 TaxID=933084 RepID=A0A067Q1E3_9AGAM|nr:hypothetical protein JAAARDRAFT_192381 [Jaapia argillacea MUCL 33604]
MPPPPPINLASNLKEDSTVIDDDIFIAAIKAVQATSSKDLLKVPYWDLQSAINLVSNAVDLLSGLHPAIKPVWLAVNGTINIVKTASENKRRVAGLQLKQAEMLCALFEIRFIKDDDVQVVEGLTFHGRLKRVCDGIVEDVKWLGNVMDKYLKERSFVHYLKADQWASAITDCATKCEDRKQEIRDALQLHATMKGDSTAAEVSQVHAQITAIGVKIDQILTLFQPRYYDAKKISDEIASYGADNCVQSDEILNRLAQISEGMDAKPAGNDGASFKSLSISELRDIRRPLAEGLISNREYFEGKLNAQTDQIVKAVRQSERRLRKIFGYGAYTRIQDPDLRALWKDMNWGGSVSASIFVMNLYDYFIDLAQGNFELKVWEILMTPSTDPQDSPTFSTGARSVPPRSTSFADARHVLGTTSPAVARRDKWCLRYFNIRTVAAVVEAVDNDISGLVRANEVNNFSASKPEAMTLMQWIAYNAYGYQVEISLYCARIERIIEAMLAIQYAPENASFVAPYLDDLYSLITLIRVDRYEGDIEEPVLQLVHAHMRAEEQRLEDRLKELKYQIDQPSTVLLLSPSFMDPSERHGRIEAYILPVLYLILRRHYELLRLSVDYIVDEREMDQAQSTNKQILELVYQRVAILKGSCCSTLISVLHLMVAGYFERMNLDPGKMFKSFSYGMYRRIYQQRFPDREADYDYDLLKPRMNPTSLAIYLQDRDSDQEDIDDGPLHPEFAQFPLLPVAVASLPERFGEKPEWRTCGDLYQRRAQADLDGQPLQADDLSSILTMAKSLSDEDVARIQTLASLSLRATPTYNNARQIGAVTVVEFKASAARCISVSIDCERSPPNGLASHKLGHRLIVARHQVAWPLLYRYKEVVKSKNEDIVNWLVSMDSDRGFTEWEQVSEYDKLAVAALAHDSGSSATIIEGPCSGCGKGWLWDEVYRCLRCLDYSLCSDCAMQNVCKDKHRPTHLMLKIKMNAGADVIPPTSGSEAEQETETEIASLRRKIVDLESQVSALVGMVTQLVRDKK